MRGKVCLSSMLFSKPMLLALAMPVYDFPVSFFFLFFMQVVGATGGHPPSQCLPNCLHLVNIRILNYMDVYLGCFCLNEHLSPCLLFMCRFECLVLLLRLQRPTSSPWIEGNLTSRPSFAILVSHLLIM